MKIRGVELRRLRMPLVAPFETSFGIDTERDVLLVRTETPESEGWGECVAGAAPLYSAEFVDGSSEVIKRFFLPALAAAGSITAEQLGASLSRFRGHPMAKAALETSILDAQLRASDLPLSGYLGGTARLVPVGVSVGIMPSVKELLSEVAGYVEQGYARIKLKIKPGWDLTPVRAVRERFGDDLLLQVDANAAYTYGDAQHLAGLDPFDLLLLEQPLPEDDLRGHAALARIVRTPICLDESIVSARAAADAIALGACTVVNIKPGRVGGYFEARRIHDVCQASGVPVWCGGMLETGIGRAANLALAALPGFRFPGDISASARYYNQDITAPFVIDNGRMAVPTGPGIGIEPEQSALAEATTSTEWIPL